ncbi:MAG TPA: hypothetical protein VIJ93_09345 [bacterium]
MGICFKLFYGMALFFFVSTPASAQAVAPYLTAATFYISVDDWADIWLNGEPIIESMPYTPDRSAFRTFACLPKHICYFKRENILAVQAAEKMVFENDASGKKIVKTTTDGTVGIAYILRLWSSDGSVFTLSSNDVVDHKSYYIPDRVSGEPRGWQGMGFNDSLWIPAKSTGTIIPYATVLTDPMTKQDIQFLSASSITSKAQYPGERHLFRRKFSLGVDPNPRCAEATVDSTSFVVKVVAPLPPKPVSIPATSTPTPIPFSDRAPAAAAIVILTPTTASKHLPPPTLRATVRKINPRRFIRLATFTPTPTWFFVARTTAEPYQSDLVRNNGKIVLPTFTPTQTLEVDLTQAQTIVFGEPPANIYITFADGPGLYQLEVRDEAGSLIRHLFEKKIVAQKEEWVEWDGKNEQMRDVLPGQYLVVFLKEGRILQKINVLKTIKDQ